MDEPVEGFNTDDNRTLARKPDDWKSKLSAAFDEDEIFFSLLILSIFFVVYAIVKTTFDAKNHSASEDDEERFIQSCYCDFNERFFFRFWFALCCVLWFLIHSYSFLAQVSARRHHKFRDPIKVLLASCIVCPRYFCCRVYECLYNCKLCKKKKQSCESGDSNNSIQNGDRDQRNCLLNVKNNLKLLWFQYCKLYVVGYARYDDKLLPIKGVMKPQDGSDHTKPKRDLFTLECSRQKDMLCSWSCNESEEAKRYCHCCYFKLNRQRQTSKISEVKHDCVCCNKHFTCPSLNITCCNEYFPSVCSLKDIVRGLLLFVKYISQLLTVPLLLLQIFDTYSLLCFTPDPYCSNTTEYKLHLLQAAITLLFYCSLVTSHLANTMLVWNPWPELDEKSSSKSSKAHEESQSDESIL